MHEVGRLLAFRVVHTDTYENNRIIGWFYGAYTNDTDKVDNRDETMFLTCRRQSYNDVVVIASNFPYILTRSRTPIADVERRGYRIGSTVQ